MYSLNYDMVVRREVEEVLDYTINGGEDLLKFGVDDFGQIVSWMNLADLALELIPACRESLNTCVDWFASNRARVEVALTILKDARQKVYNPLHVSLFSPSPAFRMLIERASGGRLSADPSCHFSTPGSLSSRNFFSEEEP